MIEIVYEGEEGLEKDFVSQSKLERVGNIDSILNEYPKKAIVYSHSLLPDDTRYDYKISGTKIVRDVNKLKIGVLRRLEDRLADAKSTMKNELKNCLQNCKDFNQLYEKYIIVKNMTIDLESITTIPDLENYESNFVIDCEYDEPVDKPPTLEDLCKLIVEFLF